MKFSIRSSSSKAIGVAVLLSVALSGCAAVKLPSFDPTNAKKVEWVYGGPRWKEQDRNWFHNASQGTATLPLPYKWFMALEQPEWVLFDEAGMLSDPQYLTRMGFINEVNKDGLPVGLARMNNVVKPVPGNNFMLDTDTGKVDAIGFTCAACHTAQINYKGTPLGIDGGPGNVNLITFNIKILEAMADTWADSRRMKRFATRVLGAEYTPAAYKQLRSKLRHAVLNFIAVQAFTGKPKGSVSEGTGRLDALTRIGNTVFAVNQMNGLSDVRLARQNSAPTSAPVSLPFIWDVSWYEWVQYDASIMSVGIRNSGEAMGVASMVNMVTPSNYWDSTVNVENIHRMESMLGGLGTSFKNTKTPFEAKSFQGLWSPKWPQKHLGKIDMAKAKKGEDLYYEMCAGCHLPPSNPLSDISVPERASFWDKKFWVKKFKPTAEIFKERGIDIPVTTNCSTVNGTGDKPVVYPWRLLRLAIIPIEEVGTDPAQATILTERRVITPLNMGKMNMNIDATTTEPAPGMKSNLFALALGEAVQNVNNRFYKEKGYDAGQIDWMNGGRPNCLQATMAYKATPLRGIWSTAPFLHNGSVPTLYDLLSPQAERPGTFWVGSKEFDPVKVGFQSTKATGLFKFDTSKAGNLNTGHEFTGDGTRSKGVIGRGLLPAERDALIEFLKTQ